MHAVVTTGNGGYDRLDWREVARPAPGPGAVLLRVLAAGMNNTEINTRLGWYSDEVTTGTEAAAAAGCDDQKTDGGWNGASPFPFIQGTDCCGRVAGLGQGVDPALLGKRVLVRACFRPNGFDDPENTWLGSNFDGAFAQYLVVPASEVFAVDCDWSDAELATLPCAYGTAENMLHRAGVGSGDRVLVPGASGGVGSAVVQLAKRRGAHVTAICGAAKMALLRDLGADRVLARGTDLLAELGRDSVDVVVDNVGGTDFPTLIDLLRRRGQYVTSGAIGGPIVALDLRKLYLKDLRMQGSTGWDAPVFPNLVGYVERGEIRPLLARSFPLDQIAQAQEAFLQKTHVGNFVLIPPAD